jgi:hypothetical protein
MSFTNQEVSIPQSLLTKIYDCTGSPNGGNKGFLMFYINEHGNPSVISNTQNTCVDMALSKLIDIFISKEIEQ